MYYRVKFDIYNFEFWSGGKDRAKEIKELGMLGELEDLIIDVFSDKEDLTEADINNFVWFEDDMINEYLDINED